MLQRSCFPDACDQGDYEYQHRHICSDAKQLQAFYSPVVTYAQHIQHRGKQQGQAGAEKPDSAGIGFRHKQAVHDRQNKKDSRGEAVEESHGLWAAVLSPKIAVPTRTQVDPSSTATSKSFDIPMESSSM